MNEKLTNLAHLQKTAQEAKGLIGQVASVVVDALEEMETKKQNAADAVTMEQVNEAIRTAVIDSWGDSY